MKMSRRCLNAVLVALPLALVFTANRTLMAQTLWIKPAGNSLSIDVLKPDFDGGASTSVLTSVWYGTLRYGLTPRVRIVADISVAHFGSDFGDSETAFGNPYLGVEFIPRRPFFFFEFGMRLPLAPEDNFGNFVGVFTELDRWEAHFQDALSLFFIGNSFKEYATGVYTRLRAGPSILVPTTDGPDTELFAVYGGLVGYANSGFDVSGGISGRAVLSERDINLGERSLHQAGIKASYSTGRIRPSLQIRFPLDSDLSDIIDLSYGIGVSIELP